MAMRMPAGGFKRPKDLKKTLRRLCSYLGMHWLALTVVAVLVVVSSLANLMGTYLLKPVINNFIAPGDLPGLARAVLGMAVMYGAGALATFGYNQLMVRTAQQVVARIRQDLFTHVQSLPLRYFDSHTHGELMSHFTNDVDTVTEALNNSFTLLIQSFCMVSGTITLLLVLNWKLSLIVIAFLSAMTAFILYSSRRSKHYFSQQQKHLGELNGFVEEMVAGQKVEKVFNHEPQDFARFCELNESLRQAGTAAARYAGMMVPTVVSLSYVNYAVSACVGGLFVLAGHSDLGSLSSYLVLVRQSAMPLNQLTQQGNFLLSALSGAERIFNLMDETPEIDEGDVTLVRVRPEADGSLTEVPERTGHYAWKCPEENGGSRLVPLKGDVRFDHVCFSYVPGKPVLRDVSLFARPGETIAFVGSTGAGKTTIINLITRFYEIDSGAITYDGLDLRRIRKDDLRRSLSVVVQDTHLFTGTIADNIRYGRLSASDEDVRQAAVLANADSFIRRLPNGYDTLLSGDGDNLSQGQRQLLAIARAAVAKPPVFILDEATSSIDTRTEKLIEQGLDSLMEGRTVFVIAHRLSTVRNADAILVVEQGQVIERGDHEALLEQKGRYYQLYTGQSQLA